MLSCLLGTCLALLQQSLAGPSTTPAPEQRPVTEKRVELNLLGSTDASRGESRRNENVTFNLIDNNALRELNARLGTSATIVTDFHPELKYFGTEYGNPPTRQIHIERPGSSGAVGFPVHGGLSFSHSNSVLAARSFFQVGSVMPARENNYGFNAALPVWRGAYLTLSGSQQKIRGYVNGNVLVPLPTERTALAADAAVRRLIERWIAAYPSFGPNRTDIDPRALNTNAPQSIDTDAAIMRIDQSLGSRDRVSARHSYTNQQVLAFQLVAGQNPDTTTKAHSSRLTWNHLFTAASVDVSVGFDRVHSLLVPEPHAVGPQVNIGTAYQPLGPNSGIPIDRRTNRYRYAVLYRRPSGNHLWTIGGEVDRVQNNGLEASSERGNYYFRNDFGRDAITNFRLGTATRYSVGLGDGHRHFRWFEQQYFAGDTWKVRSSLTLTYGARYTPMTAPTELQRLSPVNYDCDCNAIGPQLGIAWRTPRAGIVRAGYGLHFGEIYPQTLQQVRWDPPNFLKVEVQAPTSLLDPLRDTYTGPGARHIHFAVPPDLQSPYAHQYAFSWEPLPGRPWSLQLGYAGSRTRKLFMMWFRNRAVPIPELPLTTATITARRPDPRYFEFREVHNASNAYFDAAKVSFTAPPLHGLTADASYWFSKAIDTGSTYTNMAAGDDARQGYAQSEYLVAKDLKGPSAFDQTHAAMLRVQYAVPALVGAPGFLRTLANRWRIASIVLVKSGLPFSVITGSDGPGLGNVDGTNGDRPNLLDPAVLGRTIGNPDTSTLLLPRSAFAPIALGQSRGSLGFNTFRRGGIRNVNASLARSWVVHADWRLSLRCESINVLNTPQFADPNPDLSSPAFGKITNTLNDGRNFLFHLQLQF